MYSEKCSELLGEESTYKILSNDPTSFVVKNLTNELQFYRRKNIFLMLRKISDLIAGIHLNFIFYQKLINLEYQADQ